MSSIQAAKSQIAPFSSFVIAANATCQLLTVAGANGALIAAGGSGVEQILNDMGKTVFLGNGAVLRKVQLSVPTFNGVIGYLMIKPVSSSDQTAFLAQNFSRLY